MSISKACISVITSSFVANKMFAVGRVSPHEASLSVVAVAAMRDVMAFSSS